MTSLPLGWRWSTLDAVASWGSGGTPRARDPRYYGGSIPWAVIGDLTDGPVSTTHGFITEAGLAESSAKLVPTGTVLLAMYGSIGKLGIAMREMATNQAIAFAIVDANAITREYLFYYLFSQRDALGAAGKGATQLNISQTILRPWPIPVPPIDEQQRIVEILEDHLSRLDAAAAGLHRSLAALPQLRLATLVQTRRDLMADGAKLRTIGELCETTLGKMLDSKKSHGEPTPYLRNLNVRWGVVDTAEVSRVRLSEQERDKFSLRAGDVLVCEGGEPGRCAVWAGTTQLMTFQKALHRVRIRDVDELLPAFVAAMLEETIRAGRADRMFTGTTIRHLPQEKLREIYIPFPSLASQARALSALDNLTANHARAEVAIGAQIARVAALRRSLLQAAFSGRLTRFGAPIDAEERARV